MQTNQPAKKNCALHFDFRLVRLTHDYCADARILVLHAFACQGKILSLLTDGIEALYGEPKTGEWKRTPKKTEDH
jgi:hypothetical protein